MRMCRTVCFRSLPEVRPGGVRRAKREMGWSCSLVVLGDGAVRHQRLTKCFCQWLGDSKMGALDCLPRRRGKVPTSLEC
jgi:hypothetical protein